MVQLTVMRGESSQVICQINNPQFREIRVDPDPVTLLLEENRRLRVCLMENTEYIREFHLQVCGDH